MDNPHAEVEIKPQLNPRGSVAKEEDPKPSHQLYKLQIKSTLSTRQILFLAWRIPGMREPGGLPSMGSHRVGHN